MQSWGKKKKGVQAGLQLKYLPEIQKTNSQRMDFKAYLMLTKTNAY